MGCFILYFCFEARPALHRALRCRPKRNTPVGGKWPSTDSGIRTRREEQELDQCTIRPSQTPLGIWRLSLDAVCGDLADDTSKHICLLSLTAQSGTACPLRLATALILTSLCSVPLEILSSLFNLYFLCGASPLLAS